MITVRITAITITRIIHIYGSEELLIKNEWEKIITLIFLHRYVRLTFFAVTENISELRLNSSRKIKFIFLSIISFINHLLYIQDHQVLFHVLILIVNYFSLCLLPETKVIFTNENIHFKLTSLTWFCNCWTGV